MEPAAPMLKKPVSNTCQAEVTCDDEEVDVMSQSNDLQMSCTVDPVMESIPSSPDIVIVAEEISCNICHRKFKFQQNLDNHLLFVHNIIS